MSVQDSLIDRLPYYWDGDNIDSFMAIIGSAFDDTENTLDDIKATRRLDQIEGDENIAQGHHLDNLAGNVGQHRDVVKFIDDKIDIDVESENDEMFRRRVLWNIRLQESDGFLEQIKDLFTEGLIMYRVRTGLGGYVPRDLIEATDFITDVPPEWHIPDNQDIGDRRYIEPSDIYIFHNEEPRLGMSAPDSWHGKYGNLTNYYQIEIPWKALPWSEGVESLTWRSQDDFYRPYNTTFSSEDIEDSTLSLTHDLKNHYVVPVVIDDNMTHVNPSSMSVSDDEANIDISEDVEGDWGVRLTSYGYYRSFDNTDIEEKNINITGLNRDPLNTSSLDYGGDISTTSDSGVFIVEHDADMDYPDLAIFDDSDILVTPDHIKYLDGSTIEVSLKSYDVTSDWHISVIGGENTINSYTEFDVEEIVANRFIYQHNLGAHILHTVLVDEHGNRELPKRIVEKSDRSIELRFSPEEERTGTWKLNVIVARTQVPEDTENGWGQGVWTGKEEDLHIEPLQKLSDLTRPVATQVGLYGYGGMIWQSQEDFDDPSNPPKDDHHGWRSRWDGDIEETLYAMENLDGFWVQFDD